jgi:hypothetical protein
MTLDRTATGEISTSLYDFVLEAGLGREPSGTELFHYTTATGLRGIIGDGNIFATDTRFFNDTSEFEYGRALLHEPLVRFGSVLMDVGLPSLHSHLVDRLEARGGYDVFVSCYCERDDLVSQWRGYASGGAGYSIGFPWRELSRHGKGLLIGVLYGDEAVVAAANKAVDMCTTRVSTAIRNGDKPATEDLLTSFAVALLLLAACAKRDVFDFEREFRLIHFVDNDRPGDGAVVDFRTAGGMIVPFVRLELPKDADGRVAISSIRCGPSLQDSATALGVSALLRSCGLSHVPVLASDAPLRAI